jgi:deoxycytidylate deaminase
MYDPEVTCRAFQLARSLSYHSTHRVRIGAIVIQGKSIVGTGFNKAKTHPLISRKSPHKKLHAEISAIIGVDRKNLVGATMYVYRELLDGSIGICRPCCDCQEILQEAGIRIVHYTDPKEPTSVGTLQFDESTASSYTTKRRKK